ncbi:MAG: glycosyltransferase family 2 protein, partial [Alphaproteobacteria bacterium]|nr:glycosyltransferase family 2 protein [Alphaproteobacteria bacterium]
MKKLAVILPCYNEEEILPTTIKKMTTLLDEMIKEKKISSNSKLCFVNDGSCDKTLSILLQEEKKNKHIGVINLSRNFGHQGAILAGMFNVKADLYVTIDADLQDNPDCIKEMLTKIDEGCDIVYGVRATRNKDSFFKRTTALAYYRLLKLLGVNIVYNHADFRMMTARAVETLKQFPERNLFLRAIIPLV